MRLFRFIATVALSLLLVLLNSCSGDVSDEAVPASEAAPATQPAAAPEPAPEPEPAPAPASASTPAPAAELSQGPDLIVSGISYSPANPSPGDAVTFLITVKNIGNVQAGPSAAYYYAGTSRGRDLPMDSIPVGGTAEVSFIWSAQLKDTTITVIADYYDAVKEMNEGNNMEKRVFSSVRLADLIIKDISWSPASPTVGETVTFTVKISNKGDGTAAPSVVYYYVDDRPESSDSVGSLEAGGEIQHTFTWKAEEGEHIIKAIADCNEGVIEWDESNNDSEVTFSGVLFPDLIVQDITWSPPEPLVGEKITFTAKIMNQGSGKASAFQVNYYVDDYRRGYDTIDALSSGDSVTGTFTWVAEKKENEVKVIVDYNREVKESEEDNNEKLIIYDGTEVPKPDLVIQEITWRPEEPSAGEILTFTVAIKNQGAGKAIQFWLNYYVDGLRGNPARCLGMPSGEVYKETISWEAVAGSHDFKFVIDEYGQLPESNEDNNTSQITIEVE